MKEKALPWGCHDVCYYTFACPVPVVMVEVLSSQENDMVWKGNREEKRLMGAHSVWCLIMRRV
jgi:hypothetical protein